ncbi:MAG: peptidylprolyl isomerase [Candidatus Omnitrophica bacterium]|nr:peptidylprolyl isomerase [Candidatus Omnitrophota bacterium]
MKKSTFLLGCLGASLIAGPAVNAAESETNSPLFSTSSNSNTNLFPDEVVARGKGFEIKRSQVDEAFTTYRASVAAQGQAVPESRRAELEDQVLQRLINCQLLNGRATSSDKALAKETADKTFDEYRKRMPSEEAFKRQLLSLGMTVEQFRKRIFEESTFKAVIDRELKAKVTISDAQALKFYDENPSRFELPDRIVASHILFLTIDPMTRQELPEKQKEEKKALAEKILARAKAGEDFAKLAREFSEDPSSRDQGGDLPPFSHGRMVPEFENAAAALATNQISGIVTTQFGYHIIKVHEKLPARKVPFSEVKADITEYLAVQAAQNQLPDFLKKLRASADVQIIPRSKR